MKNDIERFEVFTTQIAKISKNIRTIKTIEISKYNLQSSQVSCLYYLHKNPEGLTSKELAEKTGEDKALISRSVETLKKGGFVIQKNDDKRKYKSPLVLTEKGTNLGKIAICKIESVLKNVSDGISTKQRNNFYKVLLKISENLEKICNEIGEKDDKIISGLSI